ncbi:putative mitochondrial hypothetical protein [Leptomonas pyrrhocoris]|uniref:Uncharacterized protein n=1 Tax=Leptomonas pyrrhocoris TaxID=157538 RepID=A0A0N0E077_LEPPY|nr:putative mitochondrial hypothetical protein [Leptomonas pyrrhocoris]KPA86125.1 putative mitochondrial hypothetical protein [Leptomonas pyrrhocoris]|eukprot:XP_015664564.1 putative mitochondrial hypothetical protein [Leptomonas pyrrhocoris]
MAECTVYSPCGRYVVRFTSNAQQQQLWLDVRTNSLGLPPLNGAPLSKQPPVHAGSVVVSRNTAGIVWGPSRDAVPSSLTATPASSPPRHLVASLSEGDVVALTTSAGVRKSFANFSRMLYDALIGRSACVRFYVETVAEMKERIQRDVLQQRNASSPVSSPSAPAPQQQRTTEGSVTGDEGSSATPVSLDTTNGGVAAIRQGTKESNEVHSGDQKSTRNKTLDRICAAVGDTVIELDADIADEVLEQRFITVDYDVDFTRAIFPIPLSEVTETDDDDVQAAKESAAVSAPTVAHKFTAPDTEARLERELRSTLERLACLENENGKLRRENAALVQLSKQKMHEMQRLCDDFQKRVQDAAGAEKLRAKNAELRVQLQEAIEERQAVLRTLERERSQRRLLNRPASASTSKRNADLQRQSSTSRGGDIGGTRQRSSSSRRDNPYLRSLSQNSNRGGSESGGNTRRPYNRRHGSLGSSDARRDHHGQPLLSPTPTPTSRRLQRRVPSRFDTPPGPSAHGQTRSARRSPSYSGSNHRPIRASSTHSSSSARTCNTDGGGGDSPAPRDRTGGRVADVVKPGRSRSQSDKNSADRRLHSRESSSSSLPRRGPSLWADTSDRPSPRGSVASSRGSSASHDRLYRATTVSSRQHQTPTAFSLEERGARRAVFH